MKRMVLRSPCQVNSTSMASLVVLTTSIAAQTHVPYLVSALALNGVVIGWLLLSHLAVATDSILLAFAPIGVTGTLTVDLETGILAPGFDAFPIYFQGAFLTAQGPRGAGPVASLWIGARFPVLS